MLLYISGKISDETHEKVIQNIRLFYMMESYLRSKGHKVFNPARLQENGRTWEWYMARDVAWIVENRPTICTLPNWEESRGSRLEVELARVLGLQILKGGDL